MRLLTKFENESSFHKLKMIFSVLLGDFFLAGASNLAGLMWCCRGMTLVVWEKRGPLHSSKTGCWGLGLFLQGAEQISGLVYPLPFWGR